MKLSFRILDNLDTVVMNSILIYSLNIISLRTKNHGFHAYSDKRQNGAEC